MKPKSLMLLFVAGACGLVAAFAIMQHLSATPVLPQGPPPEARKSVIVAVDDYEAGTVLKPEMLKKVEMPEQGLPAGTASDPAELTGQTLRTQVYKGEL